MTQEITNYAPPMVGIMRSHMERLFDTLSEGTGMSVTGLSEVIANDRVFRSKLSARRSFNVTTYDSVVSKFSAIWPGTIPWPADIPRQAPAPGFDPVARDVAARAWPEDIPHPDAGAA